VVEFQRTTKIQQHNNKNGRAVKQSGTQKRGNLRRLDDNSKFSNHWTETGGTCVDAEGKKVAHYVDNKKIDTDHYGESVDCQTICEQAKGCEGFAIKLEESSGQLWPTSCSLYGERVVPPHGFEYVDGDGKSTPVRGEFPESDPNYPVRCFVRVSDTPVGPGRPTHLKANLQLKKNREGTASYLQFVLTIQDTILEITGSRPLYAPDDVECDISHVDTTSQIKVFNRSTYVSPNDTIVQSRTV